MPLSQQVPPVSEFLTKLLGPVVERKPWAKNSTPNGEDMRPYRNKIN